MMVNGFMMFIVFPYLFVAGYKIAYIYGEYKGSDELLKELE